MKKSPSEWVIQNTPVMSFPLSQMIVVKPTFTLKEENSNIFLYVNIEHYAYMLPPLNWMFETEMERRTRKQIENYLAIIAKRAGGVPQEKTGLLVNDSMDRESHDPECPVL